MEELGGGGRGGIRGKWRGGGGGRRHWGGEEIRLWSVKGGRL